MLGSSCGLLDHCGAQPMQAALAEALARDVPHPNAVRLALEREREERNQPPPLALPLSERAQAMDVMVRTPSACGPPSARHEPLGRDDPACHRRIAK